ncbi:MAG: radical SAM protein [Crocinitomicaceae bacterium]|nr:radical SAM protein [Crocinitomicaceae bacterium]
MNFRNRAILKTITFSRIWNYLLLKLSFHISLLFKKPVLWGKPMAVSIEPTTACNLKCPQCPSGLRQFTRATGNLKPESNKLILDRLGKTLQHINYYFQGEPFINPQFTELVAEARKRNIYVVTSTNAHFISPETAEKIIESGLNEIIVSIDGTTQETYEKYRVEGQLDKVLEGTKNLILAKEKLKSNYPVITFQFLVVRHNEHEVKDIQNLAEKIGVDRLTLKTVQIYDYETSQNLLPENQKYSRYKISSEGKIELKNKFRNSCWRSWSSVVITWDGNAVPCCFDKDAKHKLGNLNKENIIEIRKGILNKTFQTQILKDRKSIEICKNCSEGSKVWI